MLVKRRVVGQIHRLAACAGKSIDHNLFCRLVGIRTGICDLQLYSEGDDIRIREQLQSLIILSRIDIFYMQTVYCKAGGHGTGITEIMHAAVCYSEKGRLTLLAAAGNPGTVFDYDIPFPVTAVIIAEVQEIMSVDSGILYRQSTAADGIEAVMSQTAVADSEIT